jgi:hypothetical protein
MCNMAPMGGREFRQSVAGGGRAGLGFTKMFAHSMKIVKLGR